MLEKLQSAAPEDTAYFYSASAQRRSNVAASATCAAILGGRARSSG